MPRLPLVALLVAIGLTGCAQYAPRPLPTSAAAALNARKLRVDTAEIPLQRLAKQRIDLGKPLTIEAIAALAVLNDPQLQIARDRSGVAQAQAFSAGLLPDPQFSASRDIPQGQSTATSTAYNLGLSFDLGRLITRGAAIGAARADLKDVDLQILWQEWQTAASAELAYVKLVGLRDRGRILQKEYDFVSARRMRDVEAVQKGFLPRTAADADLVELQALEQKLSDDRVASLKQRASLNTLLGLEPTDDLQLANLPSGDSTDVHQARTALEDLPRIRPDLLALRAGYQSQEEKLREAVLAQFPSFSLGFTRARDTSNVNTVGFGVSFSLPILDGSRGAIAVARATRQQLYDDYRVRLAEARSGVQQAIENIQLLRHQGARLRDAIPTLTSAANAADAALAEGNLTLPQAQAQRMALLEQQLALQANTQQIAEQSIALQLLTGRGVFETRSVSSNAPEPTVQELHPKE